MRSTNGEDRFDELARPFAEAIRALASARASDSLDLSKFQDARFREAISTLIRKVCDVLYPAVLVPEVSVAADALAQQLGVDLRKETWHSQKKFDSGYKVFHYEHMRPIGEILSAASKADSVDSVVDILRRELRLAWITKEEDKALNVLGFGVKRPDPDAAYAAAGIVLVPDAKKAIQEAPASEVEPGGQPLQASARAKAPSPPDAAPLPPIVGLPEALAAGGPQESGFMPVASGDAFFAAQLGLCLGGVVQLWTEDSSSLWSVGSDQALIEAQCRAYLARTAHGDHGFREVGLLNVSTGTLLLQPRFPEASDGGIAGEESLSFQASAVQLAPPGEAQESWADDLQMLLARAVQHTISGGSGGQLRVETGGWDSPTVPFCSVEIALTEDATPVLYLEASPPPVHSRWRKARMQPIDATSVRMMLVAKDFNPEQVGLLLRDAMNWDGVGPWDLVLTYTQPSRGVVTD